MQHALVNRSSLGDTDVALIAEACDAQGREFAAAVGQTPIPVVFYSKADGLPAVECRIVTIVDQLDMPSALGYHDDDLGVIFGRILNQGPDNTCVTASHEFREMDFDATCTGWRALDVRGDRQVALEVCDPVQADTYAQSATVGGVTRDMWLSNYVTPRWFDPAGVGPFDRMGRLSAPLTMSDGGYMIVRERSGDVVNVFAKTRPGDTHARLNVAAKVMRPGSRTLRRLRGAGDGR